MALLGQPVQQFFTVGGDGLVGNVVHEILNAVDFIVDYRREEEVLPQPSSIIKLGSKGQVKVIR